MEDDFVLRELFSGNYFPGSCEKLAGYLSNFPVTFFQSIICETVLHLSFFSSGIYQENLKDPVTLQRQVVNRITTSVRPMSLWTPVDSSSMNPSAIEATAMWQSAHGKLETRAIC